MSIDSITVISPRPNPIMYTSLQQIDVNGGVYSFDLDRVEIKNLNHSQESVNAILTHVSGNEYNWQVVDLPVSSVGVNSIQITAYALDSSKVILNFDIFVDYTAPLLINSSPINNTTNIPVNQSILLYFNESMSEVHSLPHLSMSPGATNGFWRMGGASNIFVYSYEGFLNPHTNYTITISKDVKDSIASKSSGDIFGFAGNSMLADASISFTTGSGMIANDPTRRGWLNPENVLEVEGININYSNTFEGFGTFINENNLNSFLSNQYTFRAKHFQGSEVPADYSITYNGGSVAPGVTILISPFRYKKFDGYTSYDYSVTLNGDKTSVNENVKYGYLSQLYSLREMKHKGVLVSLEPGDAEDHLPIVVNYYITNKKENATLANELINNYVNILWLNPFDRDSNVLEYKIEFSKYKSFYKKLIFHSKYHSDAFETSDEDGLVWSRYQGGGIKSGMGFTRFETPTPLEDGTWYVRLVVANKKGK